MKRIVLAVALVVMGCEGRVDPQLVDVATPDGGVQAIKQALIYPERTVKVQLIEHFYYHPEADSDLAVFAGTPEQYPSPYPVTPGNHRVNQWFGFPDIGNISPLTWFGVGASTQDRNDPNGWIAGAYGNAPCTVSTAFRDNLGHVGIAAVDCVWTSDWFQMVNNKLYFAFAPACRNGQASNGWASEVIADPFNDTRVKSYSIPTQQGTQPDFPNYIVATVTHGSPFYDRSYWQRMAQQCSDGGSMWQRPGSWHDPIFVIVCGGPGGVTCATRLQWDGGPYTWN